MQVQLRGKIRELHSGLIGLLLLCLLGAVVLLQQRIDGSRGALQKVEAFSYLPSGPQLRWAALEYREVTADVLWLQSIQFIGSEKNPAGHRYDWFFGVLDRVTDLDPQFAFAYQFGGVVMSVLSDRVDLSNAILEKGLQNAPGKWQIPFYLGFNHMYHAQDPLTAARYMEIASRLEGHPSYLPLLTARLYAAGNDTATALAFLESIHLSTNDERIRAAVARKMEVLIKERDGVAGAAVAPQGK